MSEKEINISHLHSEGCRVTFQKVVWKKKTKKNQKQTKQTNKQKKQKKKVVWKKKNKNPPVCCLLFTSRWTRYKPEIVVSIPRFPGLSGDVVSLVLFSLLGIGSLYTPDGNFIAY